MTPLQECVRLARQVHQLDRKIEHYDRQITTLHERLARVEAMGA